MRPAEIRPAPSSTRRCREIAGWLIPNGHTISNTVASPSASRARIAPASGRQRGEGPVSWSVLITWQPYIEFGYRRVGYA